MFTVSVNAAPVHTAPFCSLPVSGATQSSPSNKNDGNPVPVSVPDDGAVRAGAAFNFTDNGDGTITDHNTGLMWENKSIGGLHDKEKTLRWSGDGTQETVWDWLEDVNAEGGTGFAGYSDWRLPNIKELQSIRNYGGGSAPAPFNTKESYYWSSTTVHQFPWAAWTVFMTGGGDMIMYDKAAQEFYALAVRGPVSSECLPETGQTKSYKANKNDGNPHEVNVPDDGAIRAGRSMSYKDNGNGTITDSITGLTWEKKNNNGDLHDQDNVYHWSGNGTQETIWDWLDDVNTESENGYAGHNDWRIPNIKELISIMNYGESDPSIHKAFDTHCKDKAHHKASCTVPSKYWTSTGPTFAQFSVSFVVRDNATSLYFVRAVRGGQTHAAPAQQVAPSQISPIQNNSVQAALMPTKLPVTGWSTPVPSNKNDGNPTSVSVPDDGTQQIGTPFNFTDNGDGTITDHITGLIWEKKSNDDGLHDQDNMYRWSGDGSQDTIWDWLEDLNSENGTGFAGYNDWRIPNVKEVQSMIHYGRRAPSVHPIFNAGCTSGSSVLTGSCTPLSWIWSSTSMEGWPDNAWMVALGGVGHVYLGDKVQPLSVRAVRGGGNVLPATGQQKTYTANKNDGNKHAVPVPDDGKLLTGKPLSYTKNQNSTITDNVTGLMWEDKTNDSGLHDKDNLYGWSGNGSQETIWDWLEDINAESYAGHNDWRIPNLKELLSLVDYGRQHPGINPLFTVSSSSYRTGTAISPATTWHVGYDFGWISREVMDLPLSVRAVRAVQ